MTKLKKDPSEKEAYEKGQPHEEDESEKGQFRKGIIWEMTNLKRTNGKKTKQI